MSFFVLVEKVYEILTNIINFRTCDADPVYSVDLALLTSTATDINGLVQDCGISIANAMEIPQSCAKQ